MREFSQAEWYAQAVQERCNMQQTQIEYQDDLVAQALTRVYTLVLSWPQLKKHETHEHSQTNSTQGRSENKLAKNTRYVSLREPETK